MKLTLISTPRPFVNNFKIIQENAISSWLNIKGSKEIILFDKSSFKHKDMRYYDEVKILDVKKNSFGTPLISSMIGEGQKYGTGEVYCFINCDIVLPENFIDIINICKKELNKFLMIGHRHDLDFLNHVDFSKKDSSKKFWDYAHRHSKKHGRWGIDYFVFNKGVYKHIPDFAIGRFMYDNWLIWSARRNGAGVIDASHDVKAIHLNHNYVSNDYSSEIEVRNGEEAMSNKRLFGNAWNFGIQDSTFIVINKVLKEKTEYHDRKWYLFRLRKLYPEYSFLMKIYYRIAKLFI